MSMYSQNPLPSEWGDYPAEYEPLARALRINQHAMQLISTVMMGPVLKQVNNGIAGESWKDDGALLSRELCNEIAAAAFRLAEAYEDARAMCMAEGALKFTKNGGTWPQKPMPVMRTTMARRGRGNAQIVNMPEETPED